MDIKKLFDYEYALQSQRPEFTADENIASMTGDNKGEEFVSYNIAVNAKGGVALKFSNKNGKHTAMSYINPVMAKNLAHEILDILTEQGFNADVDNAEADSDLQTVH